MKIKTWPGAAASVIASMAVLLSACGGGGDATPATADAPTAYKLNAGNALDAAGVASLALERTRGDVYAALAAAMKSHLQQPTAGVYRCAAGGQWTLSRPAATTWHYKVENCDTGSLLLRSGEVQIDSGVQEAGLRFSFKRLDYAPSGKPAATVQTIDGRFDYNIAVTTDLGRRNAGDLSFASNARIDRYVEVYTASKTSDPNFLQYGVKLMSPRFDHGLVVVLDEVSRVATAVADDGSVLSLTPQASGGVLLELRPAAGAAVSFSRGLSTAELDAAVARALL